MSIFDYVILIGTVILGGWLAFRLEQSQRKAIPLLLSFSGAYLLGVTILHVIPDLFHRPHQGYSYWMLGGFLLQLILEKLTKGIEHGHAHALESRSYDRMLPVLIGLSLHSFLEGFPLGGYEQLAADLAQFDEHHHVGEGENIHRQLLIGISLHKMPAAFALVTMMRLTGFPTRSSWVALILFSLTAPLSAFFAQQFMTQSSWLPYLMAIVAGSFLHISTTILFESGAPGEHQFNTWKLIIILLGFGLSLIHFH